MTDIDTAEAQLSAYREHCRVLEDRVCDLRLELSRMRHVHSAVNRQLDWHVSHIAALQQRFEEVSERLAELTTSNDGPRPTRADMATRLQLVELRVAELSAERLGIEAALRNTREEVLAIHKSWSWRLTAPLRLVARILLGQ